MEPILRMGAKSISLRERCLNPSVIYQICERLPFTLQDQAHQIGEQGREKLEKIIGIINKARAKALQDSSRAQQCTIGKPSSQPKNSDTALSTIMPAPALPGEYRDTAVREDHRQEEAIEKTKPAHAHSNRYPNKSNLPDIKSRTWPKSSSAMDTPRGLVT